MDELNDIIIALENAHAETASSFYSANMKTFHLKILQAC